MEVLKLDKNEFSGSQRFENFRFDNFQKVVKSFKPKNSIVIILGVIFGI